MTNNLKLIKSLLEFQSTDDYYFLQLLKRRKDNPEMAKDMEVIMNYYVVSAAHLDSIMPTVIQICDAVNCRAYFRINRRSFKKSALKTNRLLAGYLEDGAYSSARAAFNSVTGKHHADPDKKWIIDIDDCKLLTHPTQEESDRVAKIIDVSTELQSKAKRTPLNQLVPSKTGLHIITRPFNLAEFNKYIPDTDVHRDNPLILYCP